MVNIINAKFPINLRYNVDLVYRVHARYPIVDKTTVVIIIMMIFTSIREVLVFGKILNINNLFFNMKLKIWYHKNTKTSCKVQITTPPKMRKA